MSIHIGIEQYFLIQIHFSKGNRTRWVRLWWFQNHQSSRFCFNFSKVSKFLKFHAFKLFIKIFQLFEFLLQIWIIEMLREYRAKFQPNWSNLSRKSYNPERRSQILRFLSNFHDFWKTFEVPYWKRFYFSNFLQRLWITNGSRSFSTKFQLNRSMGSWLRVNCQVVSCRIPVNSTPVK